jgi:hypothetical protein
MKRFVQLGVLWSVAWAALLLLAYVASHGEPVCTGPLILEVSESYPLQCDDPIAALPVVGLVLYGIGFIPSMVLAAVLQARDARRPLAS